MLRSRTNQTVIEQTPLTLPATLTRRLEDVSKDPTPMVKNTQTAKSQFRSLLQTQGIMDALRFINGLSQHRFTALYAFEGHVLRNICLVDKDDVSVSKMDSIKVLDSYCLYVRNSGQQFIVPNSMDDQRVSGHPKQAAIQSYCGMPLATKTAMLGTLCHFDFSPIAYTDDEIFLLEAISPLIVSWLEDHMRNLEPIDRTVIESER